jgi:hypothetical protein
MQLGFVSNIMGKILLQLLTLPFQAVFIRRQIVWEMAMVLPKSES